MLQSTTRLVFMFCIFLLGSCARQNFYQQDALYQSSKVNKLPAPEPGFVWATAGAHYQRSKLHTFFWGKHYREVWSAPVKVPLLNLAQVKGGLIMAEMGGGLQTTSLTLVNPEGRSFTLRTLDKDPAKSLSPFWRKTFLSNIMRDQTSALNPFAAFTLPPLAEAGNIYHTNPTLFYVPVAGSGLGKYQEAFGGKLVMLEEKFENKKSLTSDFGKAEQIINSEELFQKLKLSNQYQVDQLAFARARLFDILIWDLDRHEGQWNWAGYLSDSGKIVYKPIPKDRDYAYYQYADGLIPWLLTRRLLVGNINGLIHNIPDVEGLIYKGRDLDKHLLNQLSAEDWNMVAKDLQADITPQVIQEAMSQFPDSVKKLVGEKISKKLQQRVENLPEMAHEYYRLLGKNVTVFGSEKKERFVVKQLPDKTTQVEVFTLPENSSDSSNRVYHRVFTSAHTRKITLNGLGNQDEFKIESTGKKGPVIKIKEKEDKPD